MTKMVEDKSWRQIDDAVSVYEIEQIRADNNKLWMELLRLALKHAQNEAKKILRAIRKNDETISQLFGRIADGD